MATRLSGWEAITLAEREGARLSCHAAPGCPARDDLTVDEARALAARDPALVFLDVDEPAGGDPGLA